MKPTITKDQAQKTIATALAALKLTYQEHVYLGQCLDILIAQAPVVKMGIQKDTAVEAVPKEG